MATAASLDIETPPDFMEYLGFGPELSPEQRADYARRGVKHVDSFFATNVWPDTEGLRDAVERFYDETTSLARRLMRILAVALELPSDPDGFGLGRRSVGGLCPFGRAHVGDKLAKFHVGHRLNNDAEFGSAPNADFADGGTTSAGLQ